MSESEVRRICKNAVAATANCAKTLEEIESSCRAPFDPRDLRRFQELHLELERAAELQEVWTVVAYQNAIDSLVKTMVSKLQTKAATTAASERASRPRNTNAEMHEEIGRIGRSIARTHEDHEVTAIVAMRMAYPPSEVTIRKSLRRAGIIAPAKKKES